jgi:hypothetical protein
LRYPRRLADVFVGDLDDAAMIRVYARENATQRGNSGTALAGSIASAARFLAKAVLTGHVSTFLQTSPKALEVLRGQIATERGRSGTRADGPARLALRTNYAMAAPF